MLGHFRIPHSMGCGNTKHRCFLLSPAMRQNARWFIKGGYGIIRLSVGKELSIRMALETLEERIDRLESKLQEVEEQLTQRPSAMKRGWRWFVGIYADSPDFDEVVRIGQEWRSADRPSEDEASQ